MVLRTMTQAVANPIPALDSAQDEQNIVIPPKRKFHSFIVLCKCKNLFGCVTIKLLHLGIVT